MYLNLSEANGGKLIEKNKRICYNYQKTHSDWLEDGYDF